MSQEKFVDIKKILREKAPKLYRILPGFALNWLKRKLHEDQINEAMHLLRDKQGLEFNEGALDYVGARVTSLHAERIPVHEGVIIVANHPLGGLDGMAFIKTVGERRSDVHFLVNDILKNLHNYGDVFIAVNKVGATSTRSLRTMEEVFNSGAAVLIFPAGLVSRKQNGEIRDLPWKKTFVTQAIAHKRLIQPAFIEGSNSRFFYNFARWRKKLGIKGNLEMLWLPDEMFSAKKKEIRIHFGHPFSPDILDESRSHKEWAELIYKFVYSPEIRQGVRFEDYIRK